MSCTYINVCQTKSDRGRGSSPWSQWKCISEWRFVNVKLSSEECLLETYFNLKLPFRPFWPYPCCRKWQNNYLRDRWDRISCLNFETEYFPIDWWQEKQRLQMKWGSPRVFIYLFIFWCLEGEFANELSNLVNVFFEYIFCTWEENTAFFLINQGSFPFEYPSRHSL